MTPWFATERLNDGAVRITEPCVHEFYRANCFRISGRDRDIQFDFGVGVRNLTEVSPASGHLVLAIASHGHIDHVGSFHLYGSRAGHRLEAHAFAEMDDAGTLQSWFRNETAPVLQPPCQGWAPEDYRLTPAPLTQLLEDGDRVDLGSRCFTALHLPGHSPGSIALFDEMNGELFSGDAIYDDRLVDDVPGADVETYLATMRRLLDLDIRIGHGGHGPSFDAGRMHEIARAYIASKQR